MRMALSKHGHKIELHGIKNSTSSHLVSLNAIYKFLENDVQLQILLAEFSGIFEKPKGLPSSRNCDHRIPLEPSTKPVVVRPYKYPYAQKDGIEKQCFEVLQKGIRWVLMSLYGYQELNVKEVKDKFQLPVIDEPLKEFGGAKFLTKLDLRSGYH